MHVLCGVWTCCWCETVGEQIGNDEVQRENGLVRGGAQHRRRVGAACVVDWAREQGRVDDWCKVALSCVVGCSELLARQRRSVGGTGRWRRTTPAWRLGVCLVGGVADGQCGDVMVSRAGLATVAATGVRATTVGQRRGAWASDDEERTAADGNVLASAAVFEVRRVRHDEAGGRRVQATPSTSRMGGTRATADRHAGRVHAAS